MIGNHVKLVNGEDIQPVKESYIHGNVKVKIVAGIAEKKEKEKYEPESAFAIVVSAKTGEILGMGQTPAFNPNTQENLESAWSNIFL